MPRKPKDAPAEAAAPDTLTGDLLAAADLKPPFEVVPATPEAPAALALATIKPAEYVAEVYKPFRAEFEARKAEAETVCFTDVEAVQFVARQEQLPEAQRQAPVMVDITTPKGLAVAVRLRAAFRDDVRLAAEKAHKKHKAPILDIGRLLDGKKNEIIAEVEPHETRFDNAIKAEERRKEEEKAARERAEAERIAAIRAKIDAITALPVQHANSTSAELNLALKELALREATTEEFAELTTAAADAINATGDAMVLLYRIALAHEEAESLRVRLAEEERVRIAAEKEANRIEGERLAAEKLKAEQAAQEVAVQAAALKKMQDQQQRAILAIEGFEIAAAAGYGALGLALHLDDVRARTFDMAAYGSGAGMVTMARDMAIKTLEARLAQAVAEELPAAHTEALEMNAQFDSERAMADAVTTGTSISKVAISDSGEPVVTHIGSAFDIYEPPPAPAPEPAPEPAPLPLPEAYSPVDELIDMAPSDGPTDAEILELVGCEYGWDQGQTIRRLQVVLASYEVRAAA